MKVQANIITKIQNKPSPDIMVRDWKHTKNQRRVWFPLHKDWQPWCKARVNAGNRDSWIPTPQAKIL